MPPRERVAGQAPTATPVWLRPSRVVFLFLRVLCALCGFPSPSPPWFAFSGLLTPEISPRAKTFMPPRERVAGQTPTAIAV